MERKRTGFTLVELLVVVVIIGMLVGLLVPAVISARERARQGVCINRLKELATATLHYESIRGQFPGWRNQAPLRDSEGNVAQVSWVVAMFPYLGREDLWRDWRNGGADVAPVFFEQLVCPSDAGNSGPGALSYVANGYLFQDRSTPALSAVNTVVLEQLQGAQRTVMISERVNSTAYPVGRWDVYQDADAPRLAFDWSVADSVAGLASNQWGISSNHAGLVHVAFADGHVEALTPETRTIGPDAEYLWEPTP